MAYLEDAQRVRTQFLLKDKRKLEMQATLQGLDEAAGSMTFQTSGGVFEKGLRVEFLFMLEALRLGGTMRVTDVRSNLVVGEIPDLLELQERRKLPRARLNPKEGATATALTNLFEGVGVNGILESLSEGGCRIRVEKAINIKDEKRLPLGTALLPRGQPLMLLKLNKVPKCPSVMELAGVVAYLDDGGGGLSMGIEFEKPRGDFASAIRNLVSSRSGAIPQSIPPKARRKAAPEPLLADANERPARPVPQKPAEEDPLSPAVKDSPGVVVPKAEEAPLEPSQPMRNTALLRLKKRTRTVVVMAPAAFGQLLRDFLVEEGYGRVVLVASREELSVHMGQPNVGMAFLDAEMPILDCLEMVAELKEANKELPPVIVAAQEVSRALVLAAHRAGVSQLVVKPYSLDETFSSLLEQQMGL